MTDKINEAFDQYMRREYPMYGALSEQRSFAFYAFEAGVQWMQEKKCCSSCNYFRKQNILDRNIHGCSYSDALNACIENYNTKEFCCVWHESKESEK